MKNGYFLINKLAGWTSYDVIRFLKKKFAQHYQKSAECTFKKIGHAGTLDPFAEGLLIILIGKATKKFDYFQTLEKEYEAVMHLGKTTDTYDVEGKTVSEYKGEIKIEKDKLIRILESFEGEVEQMPPAFSALKIRGRPAYKMARKGEEVKLQPRKVFIKEIKLLKIKSPLINIKVTCSSGTYIRSLAYDIGEKLGYGGYLEKLKRTRIGQLRLKDAKKPEKIIPKNLKDI